MLQAQPDRLRAPIVSSRTVVLTGHVPLQARPEFDQGPVAASFPLPAITIYLKPSASQQAALQQLLTAQQNPASADYHKWLTPEQYADRFGVSQSDVNQIAAWLKSQGLDVQRVARSRTWIQFSGTAQKVENAFHTQIHRYLENGKLHYANTTDPSIPAALSGIVLGMRGLNDYRLKPRSRIRGAGPQNTTGERRSPDGSRRLRNHLRCRSALHGWNRWHRAEAGHCRTNRYQRLRYSGLPQQVQFARYQSAADSGAGTNRPRRQSRRSARGRPGPGMVGRGGAGATIIFVYSADVFTSVQEAIDQVYAPVISMSYGICEGANLVDLPSERQLAQQANSEGITWLAASGDDGAADCEDPNAFIAEDGLAVDAPGSVPEVTSMGGSEFNEGSNGTYWGANTANGASALSYIPEMVWNDTNLGGGLAAGGGGTSLFFPKPVWQTGPGVPNDGFRHVPDLSIASSPDHDGYFVSTGGAFQIYGGTSIAAPTMAGIVTLLNHYLVSSGAQKYAGLGNINPTLYRMAQNPQKAPVFHDITVGNNSVPCVAGSPDCTTGSIGYSAGPAYDQASGLGSPDAFNLIHQWTSNVNAPTASAVVPSIDQNPVFEQITRQRVIVGYSPSR